jgi:nucleotidyltransferase/DNA polymerase involved in DNA repair
LLPWLPIHLIVVAEIRGAIKREVGFTASAGIAHNKFLAKVASSLHKPDQQTTVPQSAVLGALPIDSHFPVAGLTD